MEDEQYLIRCFTQCPNILIHGLPDLSIHERWAMLSLMSLCWDRSGTNSKSLEELEGPYKLSLRDISNITGIDHTSLRNRQGKTPRIGILDHLQQIRYVTIRTGRPIDDFSGEPGREQIYLYIHLRKIWEDNETFAENWRAPKNRLVAPYQVEFVDTVDHVNSQQQNSNSNKGNVNDKQGNSNDTLDDASSNSALIPSKTDKTKEDKEKIFASSQSSDAPHSLFHQLASKGNLSEAIVALVEEKEPLTFSSLQTYLEPYMPTKGSTIITAGNDNAYMWEGMSDPLVDLLLELSRKDKIWLDRNSQYASFYKKEGTALSYPVMSTGKTVTTCHWLPCVLRSYSDHPF